MANWSISPTDATINSSGVANFPRNTENNDKPYTITYTDNDGCSSSITYTLPPCEKEYVEIGGIKWATMNIGANSVTDYGLYFQWGDTQGYTIDQVGEGSGKKYFYWRDYKYSVDTSMTKYNSSDGKTALDTSDDAAIANWGADWRMPTTTEFRTLGNNVNVTWTNNYKSSGVAGMICTDKTDSSKVLFFPAAGDCWKGEPNALGETCLYWSSSLNTSDVTTSFDLMFESNGEKSYDNYHFRYNGFPIRPVLN